jgi:hypothetical protein
MTLSAYRWLGALCTVAVAMTGLSTLATGCSSPPPPPSVVLIRVLDEVKAPIRGAVIASRSEIIAKTNDEGRAEVELTGREGTSFEVEVRCPNIYKSPTSPVVVRRILSSDGPSPEYVTHCNRLRHRLSVTIHTTGGTNMPVTHLGREVARTDQTGTAQVLIEGQVQEHVDLQIDTSDPKHAKLHPQNPVASFEIGERDETKTFDMKFTSDVKQVRKASKRAGPKAF